MSAEFVDTNILVYAHDESAGRKHSKAVELMERLVEARIGALSIQVLAEFYSVVTRKGRLTGESAEEKVSALGGWLIHSPRHGDLIRSAQLQRRFQINWRDALIVNSALELGCSILWTEDLQHGQSFSTLTARNPFA